MAPIQPMDPERWREIDRLYQAALAHPADERAGFLARACQDEALRDEVQALLQTQATAEGFLDRPAAAMAASLIGDPALSTLMGRRLGVYHLQERIGAGGMGKSIGPATRGSDATSRSRSCRGRSRPMLTASPALNAKRGSLPR